MSLSKLCKQITTATEKAIQASIEMYINKKFGNLDKGYYELDSTDLHYIQKSKSKSKIFFDRLFYHFATEKNLIQEARKACGYEIDSLHTDEISKGRVFVVTERALSGVTWEYKKYDNPLENPKEIVSEEGIKKSKIVGLFSIFLGGKIERLKCTSTSRTYVEQADIVFTKIIEYLQNLLKQNPKNPSKNMYPKAYQDFKEEFDKYYKIGLENPEIITQWKTSLKSQLVDYIKNWNDLDPNNYYLHVNREDGSVFDISWQGVNTEKMTKAFKIFRDNGYIKSNSLYYQEKTGENAYHFVI